ncbi:hypothetical protein [Paenibacillus sp. 1011MAR3C5]|uniref:hypothetical protein n=1 Tax=Paenibacillus sp. 1011MAR3C5 TaxID=1675787 RepID=UPI0016041833|nr:hypothetical protein [Paenibacillus sp. 1011MAR3C5]
MATQRGMGYTNMNLPFSGRKPINTGKDKEMIGNKRLSLSKKAKLIEKAFDLANTEG